MSFNSQEVSTQDGRPAALYRLDWGNTHWFYTSADEPIEREEDVDGDMQTVIYQPRAISDDGMVQGSSSQNDMTVNGPSDLPIVRLFRGSPPALSIMLTIRRVHDDADDAPIYWKGNVTNVKRPTDAKCRIIGRPLSASLKRTGLRLCWTRECPHFVYDSGCKVDPNDFVVIGQVVSRGGLTIVSTLGSARPVGFFRGGYVEWEANDDGTIERRMIEDDTRDGANAVLTILGLVDFLEVGDALKLYPGCNRTSAMCESRFMNLPNYGGFDNMPGKSPFDTAIW